MAKVIGAMAHSRRLQGLTSARLEREIGDALVAAGEAIRADAQANIASDTGQLAASLVVAQPGALSVEVSANTPYAAAVEFGTSRSAERPYLRPAAERNRKEAAMLVADRVRAAIRQS